MAQIIVDKKMLETLTRNAIEQKRLSEQKKEEEEVKRQEQEKKLQEELVKKKEEQRLASLKEIAADTDLMESLRMENVKKSQEQRLDWIKRVEMPESYKKLAVRSHKSLKKESVSLQKTTNDKTQKTYAQNKPVEQEREQDSII